MSEKSKVLKFFEENQIQFGSVKVTYLNGQKNLEFSNGWNSEYDSTKNGMFIQTGIKNKICVLDIDNMEDPKNKELMAIAEQHSTFIYQTAKGMHYAFDYEDEFPKCIHLKNPNLDFQTTGGIVLCPPTTYNKDDVKIKYQISKIPTKKQKLSKMPEELKEKLKQLLCRDSKPQRKAFDAEVIKEQARTEKSKIRTEELDKEKMKQVLKSLHIKRADDYSYWIMAGLALKSDGYEWELWNEFSKRSTKYDEKDCYYLWDLYLKPNRITTSTLFYWLKQDNIDEFNKLKKKDVPISYDKTIDLSNEKEYNDLKMYNLLREDTKILGSNYINIFEKTISFQYFNNFHLVITNADTEYQIEYENNKKILTSLTNIDKKYAHLKINVIDKFVDAWFCSHLRQRYDKLNFKPNQICATNIYNTFTGFMYDTPSKAYNYEKIKPLIDHIRLICNDNKVFDFVMQWWANIRQKPQEKTKVAVVLYSDTQGTGKNTTVDIIASIFKGYTASITESDIGKKFNKKFESKLFIWGDEISGNSKHDSDALKTLISQTIQNIEPKGKDEYEVDDYANYIFTTNHSIAFRIDDKDRRMLLINCLEIIQQPEYYANIYRLLDDSETVYELDKYISTFDASKFLPRNLPMTELKKQNTLAALPSHIQMIKAQAESLSGISITSKNLLIRSKEFAKNNRIDSRFTDIKVFKDISRFFGEYQQKINNMHLYVFPDNFANIVDDLVLKEL